MFNSVSKHYDILIENGNDPFYDSKELACYMNRWDGSIFIEKLCLTPEKRVLEIGIGTGRLAVKTAPLCKEFYGIDISEKTVLKAKENLKNHSNITFIWDDFVIHNFDVKFDVVYSSLTFMHIKEKRKAISKISSILNDNGLFVLSIDKSPDTVIDAGFSKIEIYPDNKENTQTYLEDEGFIVSGIIETEAAYIFVANKHKNS